MNRLKTVKWGFIGCGEVTEKKSGPAFAMIEGSQVVAVMSRNKEKQNHTPKDTISHVGIPTYNNSLVMKT